MGHQKYCNPRCHVNAKQARRRQRDASAVAPAEQSFRPVVKTKPLRIVKRKPRPPCRVCGNPVKLPNRKYCSYECLYKANPGGKAASDKRRIGADGYHALAQAKGLRWLGPEVRGIRFETEWECLECGHRFVKAYHRVDQSKGSGCPACWRGDSYRQKMSESHKALWQEPGYREKMTQLRKKQWADSDSRRRHSELITGMLKRGEIEIPKSPTTPELKVRAALSFCGIPFDTEWSPNGYSRRFDFRIWGLAPILIEVQGDYWHSPPEARERDAKKREWAEAHGYTLVELWESEINEHTAAVLIEERVIPLLESVYGKDYFSQMEHQLSLPGVL